MKQNLNKQLDALCQELTEAETSLGEMEAKAAPLLHRRESSLAATGLASPIAFTDAERKVLSAHAEAEARVVAVEEAIAGVERDLAAAGRETKALADGAAAEAAIAKAEALVKTTSAHLTKVLALKRTKQAELDTALRQQRAAEERAAQATVAALLGRAVPEVSPAVENGAVAALEAILAQIELELVRATAEHGDAEKALADLAFPIWHMRYVKARDNLREAMDKAVPHLATFMRAQRQLGWGFHLPNECDMDTALRTWQQAHAEG